MSPETGSAHALSGLSARYLEARLSDQCRQGKHPIARRTSSAGHSSVGTASTLGSYVQAQGGADTLDPRIERAAPSRADAWSIRKRGSPSHQMPVQLCVPSRHHALAAAILTHDAAAVSLTLGGLLLAREVASSAPSLAHAAWSGPTCQATCDPARSRWAQHVPLCRRPAQTVRSGKARALSRGQRRRPRSQWTARSHHWLPWRPRSDRRSTQARPPSLNAQAAQRLHRDRDRDRDRNPIPTAT